MAGETRRQRRDARRAAGEQTPAQTPSPAPAQQGDVAVVSGAQPSGGFIRQSWGELKKVEWPNRAQVVQGTIVVIIACAIVGAYLWGIDKVLQPFVRDVLIG